MPDALGRLTSDDMTPKRRHQISLQMKQYWKDPTYRENQVNKRIIPLDFNEVVFLYCVCRMSLDEVAVALNSTQKVVLNNLKRQGIPRRGHEKRDQWGERNSSWKGDNAGYSRLHIRVEKVRGKPNKCEMCGIDDSMKTYDWANQNGIYSDPFDYKRLCRSCHCKSDSRNKKSTKGRNS